ncbi:MAG: hypothetical protein D6694_12660, partial [Gammaproteobacteria bacterium]
MRKVFFKSLTLALALCFISGCAKDPYVARRVQGECTPQIDIDRPQIEQGRPNFFLDLLGNIWSLPSKILLLDTRVGNHHVSDKTTDYLRQYLKDNDLCDVKVRVNQYAPGAEWRRL